jgi:flagellar hook assembly protein FlgD
VEYIRVDRTAAVIVNIYNTRGQLVRAFDEGVRPAGWGQVRWDGLDMRSDAVASGIYLYELQAGSKSTSKKMLLVK